MTDPTLKAQDRVEAAGGGFMRVLDAFGRSFAAFDGVWLRLLFLHVGVFSIAYALAFAARFEFSMDGRWAAMLATLPLVVAIQIVIAQAFSLLGGCWRYVSLSDMRAIALATTLSSAILFATSRVATGTLSIPPSIIVIDWGFAMLLLAGIRVAKRVAHEGLLGFGATREVKRVLILGAGDAGELLLRDIAARPESRLAVVGFLDDDLRKRGRRIRRVPIMGPCDSLADAAHRTGARLVLIAIPGAAGKARRRLVDLARRAGIACKTLPSVAELVGGAVTVSSVRPVAIQDLLGRAPVEANLGALRACVSGRSVLVTGACGSIGSELCRQIAALAPARLVLLDRNENGLFWLERSLRDADPANAGRVVVALGDVTDAERGRAIFAKHEPHVVFHAAAVKHVPLIEQNPTEAVRNNVVGTATMARIAEEAGVEVFVLISTDKAVNPTCAMGRSKRQAELYLLDLARKRARTRFVSVRFGNVLGSAGSVVPIFQEQIERGGPVTITHPDMKRFLMTIPEAVQLVIEAAHLGRGGEIFVLDMGEPVRIVDLAQDMIRLSGLAPDEIEIVVTGIRPGEKLEEELHSAEERLVPTTHPWIRMIRVDATANEARASAA